MRRNKKRQTVIEKEAARYRWWRSHWVADSDDAMDALNDVVSRPTGAKLDAAIDAAIEKQPLYVAENR